MSFLGKLGKGLLKVAPIAASFIPGVGPLAAAAIGGISKGVSKKLEGGSWGDAIKSGAIGAGTSYGLDKITAAKGLGTSKASDYASKAVKGIDKGAAKLGGSTSILGKIGQAATSKAGKTAIAAGAGLGALGAVKKATSGGGKNQMPQMGSGDPRVANQLRRGLGPVMGSVNQRNPNFAESIGQGRMEAIRNQPWRSGYDVNYLGSDDTTPLKQTMNPIYPQQKKKKTSIFDAGNQGNMMGSSYVDPRTYGGQRNPLIMY